MLNATLHSIWAVGCLRGGLRGGLWVAGWVVVCVAERAWRRGDGRRGILLCALVSGSKAEAATVSRLPQSGRHDRVHSDPPAASHPRTGGRRRSRRVATPLRGTISTRDFVATSGQEHAPARSCMITQRRKATPLARQLNDCFRRWSPGLAESGLGPLLGVEQSERHE